MSRYNLAEKQALRTVPVPNTLVSQMRRALVPTHADPRPPGHTARPVGPASVVHRWTGVQRSTMRRALLQLQRQFGNHYVAEMIRRPYSGVHGVVSRAATASHDTAPNPQQIDRYAESAAVSGMGSGAGKSTVKLDPVFGEVNAVNESGPSESGSHYLPLNGMLETLVLGEDVTGGTVKFHLFEQTEINNLVVNDHQWGSWNGIIPFVVNGDQIVFQPAIPVSQTGGSGATMTVTAAGGVTPGGGYVAITATIAASGSQTQGGSVGAGPISASVPLTGTTNYAGGITRSFVVNLRTTPPRPIAGPDVSFKVGSDQLEGGQEAAIAKWYETLSPAAQDMIRNGRRAISISGYASTTGRNKNNRNLSERRAHVVEHILRGHAGSNANLNIFFFGEDNATTPDETEDPTWRRATIVVQLPSRTAPGLPGPARS